ncbi:hypothetical protein CANARDRAFT_7688 [[Candida] arabinofermentans NRRL YB-2248]|uniref:Protein ZIP4 homolog n=1 Tax=[Candida] arabinofermentans NRRL YB-2248 TaxID=983967 RepID=A0A1E4T1J5_9ASCO|nr:hypothetical protein CANARDRAFT_7688 [[Candida] arabinofermentans NRRL YB-2248]
MQSSIDILSTINELIAASDKTTSILNTFQTSEDKDFDILCIDNRFSSLFPIVLSTEKYVRNNDITIDKKKLTTDLELSASNLWNAVAISMKENTGKYSESLTNAKFFSGLLLSLHEALVPSVESKLRLFRCMLQIFNICIDEKQIDTAGKVQGFIEKFHLLLDGFKESFSTENKKKYQSLCVDLFLMDMQYALVMGDLKLAKFYENKADIISNMEIIGNKEVLNIARVLYNSGLKLYNEENHSDAYHFSKRSCLIVEALVMRIDAKFRQRLVGLQTIEQSCLVLLIKCCMKQNDTLSIEESHKLILLLQKASPKTVEPFKLMIELLYLQKSEQSKIEEVFMQMIMTIPLNHENFKEVLGLLNKNSVQNPEQSKRCLLYVFNNKLQFDQQGDSEIAEFCLTSLLWMVTVKSSEGSNESKLEEAKSMLELAERKFLTGLSRDCLSCTITLFWSMGKSCIKLGNNRNAISWFELCLHRFLVTNDKNQINKEDTGKIYRNILRCYLQTGEFESLIKLYQEMSQEEKLNPLTQYYMFSCYLGLSNYREAIKSLEQVSMSSDSRSLNVVALCVIKAQDSDKADFLNEAMSKLLKVCAVSNGEVVSDNIILPIALRASVYLATKQFESQCAVNDNTSMLNSLALLKDFFAQSINVLSKVSQIKASYDSELAEIDLEWFASSSYSIGVTCLKINMESKAELFFTHACTLIDLQVQGNENLLPALQCWMIRASLLKSYAKSVALRKSTSSPTDTWVQVQTAVEPIWKQLCGESQREMYIECNIQAFTLLAESLCELGKWDELSRYLKELAPLTEDDISKLLDIGVSLIISKNVSNKQKIKVFDIVMDKWAHLPHHISIVSVSKWVRLFAGALIDDSSCSETLISHANSFCSAISSLMVNTDSQSEDKVPSYEMEWLASTFWNKGVTLIVGSSEVDALIDESLNLGIGDKWCQLALKLSAITNERLESQLSSMYPQLISIAKSNSHKDEIIEVDENEQLIHGL